MKKYLPYIIYYAIVSVCLIVTLGFCFNKDDNNNSDNDKLTPVSYELITPDVPALSNINAEYGDSLADVKSALPAGFSFEAEASTLVGELGSHTFLVSYKVPNDTAGRYKTVTGIQITVVVSPKQLTIPTVMEDKEVVYSGEEIDVKTILNYYDSNFMEITENEFVTDAGNHQTKIKITNTNYAFVGGETETSVEWTVSKLLLTKPVLKDNLQENDTIVYTGEVVDAKTLIDNYNTALMEITENEFVTDAGNHQTKIKITNTNYAFAGGETEVLVSWSMSKMKLTKPTMVDKVYRYTGSRQTLELVGYDAETMTISGNTGSDVVGYTAKINLKNENNYCWADGTTNEISYDWQILKRQLKKVEVIIPDNAVMNSETKPTSNRVVWFTVPYVKGGVTLQFVNGDQEGLTISGNTLYDDGDVTRVSVSLDPYSEWEDGTADAYVFRWKFEVVK